MLEMIKNIAKTNPKIRLLKAPLLFALVQKRPNTKTATTGGQIYTYNM
jgi:hypothetical protein